MWAGVLVIAFASAVTFHWLAKQENRQHIERGLFG
jgi:hypothetical protein